jgi:hypothetical protein
MNQCLILSLEVGISFASPAIEAITSILAFVISPETPAISTVSTLPLKKAAPFQLFHFVTRCYEEILIPLAHCNLTP